VGRPPVRKNTSSPLCEASRKADSPAATPEEMSATQPPDAALNVEEALEQSPTPAGSN